MEGKTAAEELMSLIITAFGEETVITEADLTWDSIREIAEVSPEVLAVYQMGTRYGLGTNQMLIGMVLALFRSLAAAQAALLKEIETKPRRPYIFKYPIENPGSGILEMLGSLAFTAKAQQDLFDFEAGLFQDEEE